MCSVQPLREFIRERLTAAAEEIFTQVEKTIVQFEEELHRQSKLLDLTWRPRTDQNHADPQQNVLCNKKDVLSCNRVKTSGLQKEEPELLPIKEEPDDLCSSQAEVQITLKEENDAFLVIPACEEPDCVKLEPNIVQIHPEIPLEAEDHEGTSRNKELQSNHHHCLDTDEWSEDFQQNVLCNKKDVLSCNRVKTSGLQKEEPELLPIKNEPDDLCSSQAEVQITLKEENDAFLVIPACEEPDCVKLEPNIVQIHPEIPLEADDHEATSRNKELQSNHHHCLDTDEWSEAKTLETNMKLHFCKMCSKSFTQKRYLTRHLRVHSTGKPVTCPTCSKSFKNKLRLLVHLRSHAGERPFKCGTCGRRFSHQISLSLHTRVHTDKRSYECKVCGKRFLKTGNLTRHLLTHTGEKSFLCLTCGKRFRQRAHLNKHIKIHQDERPFKCPTCGKTFRNNFNLVAHMRTHTGERPFQCGTCGKSFCQRGNLKVHIRTHTGEKPFSCVTCGKRFQRNGCLTAHMSSHY